MCLNSQRAFKVFMWLLTTFYRKLTLALVKPDSHYMSKEGYDLIKKQLSINTNSLVCNSTLGTKLTLQPVYYSNFQKKVLSKKKGIRHYTQDVVSLVNYPYSYKNFQKIFSRLTFSASTYICSVLGFVHLLKNLHQKILSMWSISLTNT